MKVRKYETIELYLIHIMLIELLIIANLILIEVAIGTWDIMHPSPEVIHYMQNCDNITLYPQGCQVLS